MTQKDRLSHKIFKYTAIGVGTVLVYYLLDLIPGSSPLKYVASLVSVGAIIHTVQKDRVEAKKKGEQPSVASDKLLAIVALLVALLASISDDYSKYKTDQASQIKSNALAKSQSDLAEASNKLAELTNENTRKGADEAAKTRVIASQTKAETARIKQDDKVIVLDQRVLKALAKQNNKIAKQNALEQRRDALRQEGDARRLSFVTRDQAALTRDTDKATALHSDVLQASRSIHNLRETLYGFERTLNPLKDMRLSYQVVIPLNDPSPQMRAYKALLDKAVQSYQSSLPATNTTQFNAVGGEYRTEEGWIASTSRLTISRGSALYPTDTKILPGSLFNAPMKVGVWHKSSWKKLPSGQVAMSYPEPDMELEIPMQAVPELWYYPAQKVLVLAYTNIAAGVYSSTAKITSLPDLEGAWVVVKENDYNETTQTFSRSSNDAIRRQCVISKVAFQTSNRFIMLVGNELEHRFDGSGKPLCTFIFDSKHSSEINRLTAPDWWDDVVHK